MATKKKAAARKGKTSARRRAPVRRPKPVEQPPTPAEGSQPQSLDPGASDTPAEGDSDNPEPPV